MARRGFWDSFYQGWEQGDKIGERNRGLQQRAEFKKISGEDQVEGSEYSPDQIQQLNTFTGPKDGEKWDEASQSYMDGQGNSRAVANVPQYENGGYNVQGVGLMQPKKSYTLGNKTQDTKFLPDQVQDYRNNRYADVYAANGDIDKAMGVRASAQTLKLGKVQLEEAEITAKEAKVARNILKVRGDLAMGVLDPAQALQKAISIVDPANNDGKTFGYKEAGDGKFEVFMMQNDKMVWSQTGTINEALQAAYNYATPKLAEQAELRKDRERTFQAGRDDQKDTVDYRDKTLAQNQTQFEAQQKTDDAKRLELIRQFNEELRIKQQDANSTAGLRRAQSSYYGRDRGDGGDSKGVGYIASTGQSVEYSKGIGYFTRGADGKPEPVKDMRTISSIGNVRPDKGITLDDRKKAEELLRLDPAFDSMPRAKQDEARNALLGITPEPTMQVAPPPSADKTGGLQAKKPLDWDKVDNVQRAIGGLSESRKRAELLEAANAEARRLGTYNK